MQPQQYRVIWEIDVDATCPLEAAKRAREFQLPPTSAVVFHTVDPSGFYNRVDLLDGTVSDISEHVNWPDAFNKFGFGDGDGTVHTHKVSEAIAELGYNAPYSEWGCHNTVIDEITAADGQHIFPPLSGFTPGYDDPREVLPENIIAHLNTAFGPGEWWG